MSSDRPGGPADVVPGGADGGDPGRPEGAGQGGGSRARHRERDPKKSSLLRELPVLLLVAFVLAVLVKTFLVQAFFIPSGSMEQTLHGCPGCTGDRVLVNKVPYWFDEPQPGDIVVFTGPDTWTPEVRVSEPTNWVTGALLWLGRTVGVAPPSEDDFIKRVIAVGGQTVQCCDAEGRVTVDGEPLDEPYIYEDKPLESRTFPPVTVPEGRLWVMGDHRSASADSTVHIGDQYSGTISVDDVIGKAAVIVWPPSRIGLLDAPAIQAAGSAGQGVDAGPGSAGVQAVAPGMTATPAVPAALAAAASPGAIGLAAALPVAAWRAAGRRSR